MNEIQRTKQQQAIHITFKRMQNDGIFPLAMDAKHYAGEFLGRRIDSLKELNDVELNAVRDRLNGKDNKVLLKIMSEAKRLGIVNLDGYLRVVSERYRGFSYLRGYTVEMLPLPAQMKLLAYMSARQTKTESVKKTKVEEPLLF